MSGVWAFSCWHGSQGLLIIEDSQSHADVPYSVGLSGRVIGPSQRPEHDNTQHPQQTPMPAVGFEPAIQASERLQAHALDRADNGTGRYLRVRNCKCANI